MEMVISSILLTSLCWYIYVAILQQQNQQYKKTIRKIILSGPPQKVSKRILHDLIYYSRMYMHARKYNTELKNVVKEMWCDARVSPLFLTSRDLNKLMEDYKDQRKLFSQDWSVVKFPQVTIEDLTREEMKLANEVSHEK